MLCHVKGTKVIATGLGDPLKMEAAGYSETLPKFYPAKKRHIPEYSTLHTHHSEDLKSHEAFTCSLGSL